MNKRSVLFFLFWLINAAALYAQNLVFNGDFEAANICAEYQELCAPVAWRSTSEKLFGYNEESKRNKYATLTLYSGGRAEDRKFIQTELLCPLQKDDTYKISFWIEGNIYFIHSICVGFSDQFEYHDSWLDFAGMDKKCVEVESLIQIGEWVKVEMEYKAKGNEKFVVIGNLNKDADTSYSIGDKKAFKKMKKSYTRQAYIQYEIDNVFIKSLTGELCEDYELRANHVQSHRHRHSDVWLPYEKPKMAKLPITIGKEAAPKDIIKEEGPKPEIRKIILRDLFFETNSHQLDLTDQKELQALILEMRENKKISIQIVGHTDQVGTADYNMDLSLQRANAVKSYLSQQGVNPARMRTEGKGEAELLSEGADEASLRKNRRVEIEITEY